MIYESFATGKSFIHRIDPRIKVLFATLYSIVVAISQQFQTLGLALGISILLIFLAQLNLKAIAKKMMTIMSFLLLIWVVVPLTFEGEAWFQFGPLTLTRPGIQFAAQITLKSISILTIFIALITTMTLATLGNALHRLRIPAKIVYLLLMTYRYIFVIDQEYKRLRRAATIRGFQPGTNMHTYRTFAYFIGMLFVQAIARAERVYQAMKCRGFNGNFYSLGEFRSFWQNWIFLILMIFLLLGLAFLEWTKIICS
jgi:cobalt/nickel transport system permease protein